MNEEFRRALWQQYEPLVEVGEQAVAVMGKEKAWTFVDISNDWIDLNKAIQSEYPRDAILCSLVYLDFIGLFQQIRWLQLLFLGCGYPMVYRNLRFVWELAFRAHHVETFAVTHANKSDPPGATVDEKIAWLEGRERKGKLNWTNVIEPTLGRLLPSSSQVGIEGYRNLWERLNSCVHPTQELRKRMIMLVPDSAVMVTDAFDEEWAGESLGAATLVFDLVWLTVLDRFPNAASAVDFANAFRTATLVREVYCNSN